MSINSDIYARVLGSVSLATGSPANDALENYNTTTLDDGALCYVSGGAGAGMWQLERDATDTPDGVEIVEPAAGGPGRWFKKSVPGPAPDRTPIELPFSFLDLTTSYQALVTFDIEEDGWYQFSAALRVANGTGFNGAPVLVGVVLIGPTSTPLSQHGFFPVGPGIPTSGVYWQGGEYYISPTLFILAGSYEIQAAASVAGGFTDTQPRLYNSTPNPWVIFRVD